jgi:hypothetical protein
MTTEFKVSGYFYEISGFKFRKFLDIKENDSKLAMPDLMVVMMNPGSSYPLNGNDDSRAEVAAAPDRTQYQIMTVMGRAGFTYARILNLSDKRESNSNTFYKFLKSEESKKVPHSIFDKSRSKDFENLFIDTTPVICAWGVNSCLCGLASMAIPRLHQDNIIGIKKRSLEYAYYHPLPRVHQKQIDWANRILQQITSK